MIWWEKGILMCFDLLLKKYLNCRFLNWLEINVDMIECKLIVWILLNFCLDSCGGLFGNVLEKWKK